MSNFHTAKKPTISSSFYDSHTDNPVKWYEVVDAYRQYDETYLPLRLDNYPREMLDNFKNFFKNKELTEEIDDENPVVEVEQTRKDGNVIKVTEYDLSKDNFDPTISAAVRSRDEKAGRKNKGAIHPIRTDIRTIPTMSNSNPNAYSNGQGGPPFGDGQGGPPGAYPSNGRHGHPHSGPGFSMYDDCPECRALAAQSFPVMCECADCRAKRAVYPYLVPYCDCYQCRGTRRNI